MVTKDYIDSKNIPQHIAIIMDGNGRWAKKQGEIRSFGHQSAVKSVKETTETCAEIGVKVLTLYAFSTENWARPIEEVNALMQLLVETIHQEKDTLKKNNIKFETIGNINKLPTNCIEKLNEAKRETIQNNRMVLILALNYSGKWDLTNAFKNIQKDISKRILSENEITEKVITKYLSTAKYPDPELLIRTSGEMRISNFLLWQIAYSEIYVTDVLWPDFRKKDLIGAINNYQQRDRRFGKISE